MKACAIVVFSLVCLATLAASAQAQTAFQCEAFQLRSRDLLKVVKATRVTDAKGETVTLQAGDSVLRGAPVSGVDVFALYQQSCGG